MTTPTEVTTPRPDAELLSGTPGLPYHQPADHRDVGDSQPSADRGVRGGGRGLWVLTGAVLVAILVAAGVLAYLVGSLGDEAGQRTGTDPGGEVGTSPGPAEGDLLEGRTVVIDPGHNGANAEHRTEIDREVDAGGLTKACDSVGASADGVGESEVNLAISTELQALLEDRGAEVVMTRTDDEGWGPCIDERGETASRADADLLLSVHADGAEPAEHGFHAITSPGSADGSDALADRVRDAMLDAGFTPATYAGTDGREVRSDLGTLRATEVPVALIECGNMDNPGDLDVLSSAEGQERIATALADAVSEQLADG